MPIAELNGVRLYYELIGEGPPLVLLHGGGMSSAVFGRQKFTLAKQHKLIAIDSRAHGRTSDGDPPLSYAQMAADTLALLDILGIARASYFGWSDGGVIALHLALYHPERVTSAAIFGTNYQVRGLTPETLEWMKNVTPETWPRDMADAYRRESPHPERWPILVSKLKSMWLREPEYPAGDLARITCPLLIAAGDRDMIRLEHTIEMFHAIPRAQLAIFPGATHFVLWEQPARVNDILTTFFR